MGVEGHYEWLRGFPCPKHGNGHAKAHGMRPVRGRLVASHALKQHVYTMEEQPVERLPLHYVRIHITYLYLACLFRW